MAQNGLYGYSKIMPKDSWHHERWINKFDHQTLAKRALKWPKNGPKMAYLGPKWPFSKFQQSTLCGYSKIVSRDAWHYKKWINKFDHQCLAKITQKSPNRTQHGHFPSINKLPFVCTLKIVSGNVWHYTKWFTKIWSNIFSQNVQIGPKMAN